MSCASRKCRNLVTLLVAGGVLSLVWECQQNLVIGEILTHYMKLDTLMIPFRGQQERPRGTMWRFYPLRRK